MRPGWLTAPLTAALTLGCTTEDTAEPAGPSFSIVADDLPVPALLAAWTEGDEALFVGGTPGSGPGWIVHHDGDSLCSETVTERTLWWIAGDGAGTWYAVGEAGTVLRESGGTRTREDIPTDATLFGVEVSGSDVIAVGGRFSTSGSEGEVWRRRDGTWSLLAGALPGAAFKVWNGWIVGDGVVYRLDGDTLTEAGVGDSRLLTVRGRADDDVWAVGGLGAPEAWHWNGSAWAAVDVSGLGQPLNGVWTAPGEDVFVAGNYLTAAFFDGATWTQSALFGAGDFHAVWQFEGEPLWVGGDMYGTGSSQGTILRYGEGTERLPVGECDTQARSTAPAAAGVLGLASIGHAAPVVTLGIGDAAPNFALPGTPADVNLAMFHGAPVVVNFWATWCAPCLAELPLLDSLAATGVRVLGVNIDREIAPPRALLQRLALRFPVAWDSEGTVARAWNPDAMPTTYVLDADGVIRSIQRGAIRDLGAISATLAALAAPAPTTPSP